MFYRRLRTFKITTFGCRVNQAESRMMGEELVRNKFIKFNELLARNKKPDLVIINSCCVTGKAEREVRKEIRRVKRENPNCFLAVTGCWVSRLSSLVNLTRCSRAEVDTNLLSSTPKFLLISNKDKPRIAELIQQKFPNYSINNYSNYQDKYALDKKAIIKIQEGCNNFCRYCVVPYVRGRSISRAAEEIISEIKKLAGQGIEEIILTGTDIEDYKFRIYNSEFRIKLENSELDKYKNNLVKLIRLILRETKVKKISFGSMGWQVFDKEFFELYKSDSLRSLNKNIDFVGSTVNLTRCSHAEVNTNFCSVFESPANKFNFPINSSAQGCKHKNTHKNYISPRAHEQIPRKSNQFNNRLSSHFHIPLQSGCNETLKRMGRKYQISNIKFLISNLKKHIPGFTFSTDIIVGFPGETEKEFRQTMREIRGMKKMLGKSFTKIHVFRYSSREGTLAEKMEKKWGGVAEKIKKQRLALINQMITNFSTN